MNLEKQFRRLRTKQNAGTIDRLKAFINEYDGFCHIFCHEFSAIQLKEFITMGAWVLVGKNTDLNAVDLDLLIDFGKQKIIILANGYSRTEVEQFLAKGAVVAFAESDGFGSAYIETLVTDSNQEQIRILPHNWKKPVLEVFLNTGLKIYLSALSGLTTEEILALIQHPKAKELLVIPHEGYSKPLLFQFAQHGGTIRILHHEGLDEGDILRLIDLRKNQTQVSLYEFDPNQINTYEDRGAVVVDI